MIREFIAKWKQSLIILIIVTLAATVPVRQTQWGLLTIFELLRHLIWEKLYIYILNR